MVAVYRPPIPPLGCLFSFFLSLLPSAGEDDDEEDDTPVVIPSSAVTTYPKGTPVPTPSVKVQVIEERVVCLRPCDVGPLSPFPINNEGFRKKKSSHTCLYPLLRAKELAGEVTRELQVVGNAASIAIGTWVRSNDKFKAREEEREKNIGWIRRMFTAWMVSHTERREEREAAGEVDDEEDDTPVVIPSSAVTTSMRGTPVPTPSVKVQVCLLYTSPSPRDLSTSRMPSSA